MISKLLNYFSVGIISNEVSIMKWSANSFTKRNIGDAINPFLFEKITGKKVIHISKIPNLGFIPVYSFIGSVLDNSNVRNLVIVGSGFKDENSPLPILPKKVIACRGPLTRKKLLEAGVDFVPEIYGDPAILMPKYFDVEVEKISGKIGFIPHYVDKDNPLLEKFEKTGNILIIDVLSEMKVFIKNLKSCEFIISTSLHGIILAHAYKIPAVWGKMSQKIVGGDFKFNDYFLSVNLKVSPVNITSENIETLIAFATLPELEPLTKVLQKEIQNNIF